MEKTPRIFVLVNLFLILLVAGFIIWQKESTLQRGKLVFLELQPVDPRSLMQGDYMDLRYKLCTETMTANQDRKGILKVRTNNTGIVEQLIFSNQDSITPRSEDLNLKYHISNEYLRLGAESYFFQEGKASSLDSARYGGLILDEKGNSILVGLYDRHLIKL